MHCFDVFTETGFSKHKNAESTGKKNIKGRNIIGYSTPVGFMRDAKIPCHRLGCREEFHSYRQTYRHIGFAYPLTEINCSMLAAGL